MDSSDMGQLLGACTYLPPRRTARDICAVMDLDDSDVADAEVRTQFRRIPKGIGPLVVTAVRQGWLEPKVVYLYGGRSR